MKRLAVIGAGWAGLAAAVRATQGGHAVTLFEMSRHWGGRARTVERMGDSVDNGQHILIGAYTETLALMRSVGVDPEAVLVRMPLALTLPDGTGLRLRQGPPIAAFVRGVLAQQGWRMRDRLALLHHAGRWGLGGFRCAPELSVAALCRGMPAPLRNELIDPLCIAALNTPADEASAMVFLRVLRDALFSGPGSADLLLPRASLNELLPDAATRWLVRHGAQLRSGIRINDLHRDGKAWAVDSDLFDAVILACTAVEAARLSEPHAPAWSKQAAALRYEPIVTVVIDCQGARLPAAMVSLPEGPAQFAFDHGAIGARRGRFTFVISGAQGWVDAGQDATARAILDQASAQFPQGTWPSEPLLVATMAERRATFRCTPGLLRPPMSLAPGLFAAGDFIAGPYPATLEGAVRSGRNAAAALS